MNPVRAAREPLLWLVMTLTAVTAVAEDTPQSWLNRMNAALTTRNYDGVFPTGKAAAWSPCASSIGCWTVP